jgi:hypothetical protein
MFTRLYVLSVGEFWSPRENALDLESSHRTSVEKVRVPVVPSKLVPLAFFLIVGLLSVAPSAAYARAVRTAVSGDQSATVSVANATFQSVGRWTVITNGQLTGNFEFTGAGVTLAGPFTRVVNVKIDSGNNGTLWGTVRYVDATTGVTCTGFNHGRLTNNFLTGELIASCSDGSLLRGTLQDTNLTYDNQHHLIAVVTHFDGTLLNPNGQ